MPIGSLLESTRSLLSTLAPQPATPPAPLPPVERVATPSPPPAGGPDAAGRSGGATFDFPPEAVAAAVAGTSRPAGQAAETAVSAVAGAGDAAAAAATDGLRGPGRSGAPAAAAAAPAQMPPASAVGTALAAEPAATDPQATGAAGPAAPATAGQGALAGWPAGAGAAGTEPAATGQAGGGDRGEAAGGWPDEESIRAWAIAMLERERLDGFSVLTTSAQSPPAASRFVAGDGAHRAGPAEPRTLIRA